MPFALDGGTVDIATLIVGLICILVRPAKRFLRKKVPLFTRRDAVVDFLNGATIVPFFLLVGSACSNELLSEALKAKLSMGLAGVIGTIFILGELLSSD